MYQEMNLAEAVKAYEDGRNVLAIERTGADGCSGEWVVTELREMFEGIRLLVDVPAVVNPEFEEALPPVAPPLDPTAPNRTTVDSGAKRKKVDVGKLLALRKAGWTMKEIAEELHVSEATVCNYLKKTDVMKDETL